jgi:D-aminopeptidase
MITFSVVKEKYGWAIRLDERMTTPFRVRELAIREAKRLADAIRRHGECTEVVVEDADESMCSLAINRANPPQGAARDE